jgi:hypothetical protein
MNAVQHPRHDLRDLLAHAVRFSVLAALAGVERRSSPLCAGSPGCPSDGGAGQA